MAVTYASFTARFPELATTTEPVFNGAYSGAINLINTETYDTRADEALLLLTAHYVILSKRAGTAGAVISEKVGDLSVTYSNDSSTSKGLNSTSYGQSFLDLRKRSHFIPIVL